MCKLLWIAVLAILPMRAFADVPSLNNITAADYEKIVKELSANFAYSSVTPASSLGGLWGFELGVVAGVTKTPEILNLVRRSGGSYNEDKFPHGGALLRIGAPLGFTGEIMAFPQITVSDLTLSQYAGAAQWTMTDLFFTEWPVAVAFKGFYSATSLSYKQRLQNSSTGNVPVDATIDFDDDLYGLQALVSKKFLVFEPYLGAGYVKANGKLAVSASIPGTTIFSGLGTSATSKPSSLQLMGGLDVRLLFISLGAEYQRAFGTNSFNGRLSFRF